MCRVYTDPNINMPICRSLFFHNMTAYNIQDTLARVTDFYTEGKCSQYHWTICADFLVNMKYSVELDEEDLMMCPFTEEYMSVVEFFKEWGVIEMVPMNDDLTIGTFDVGGSLDLSGTTITKDLAPIMSDNGNCVTDLVGMNIYMADSDDESVSYGFEV